MKPAIIVIAAAVLAAPAVKAADMAAGKAKAEEVCAACHGANGVSVSAKIPNLAGQKEKYLVAQLKAFKSQSRKNALMNPIAQQLSGDDMANLAAHFSSQAGASGTAMSKVPAHILKTHIKFPQDYAKTFTHYTTINFAKKKQVRKYYVNEVALNAARAGKPLPNGSMIFVEVYKTKLDGSGNPVKGADGFFAADKLALYTAMEKQAGWGKDIPEMLKNGDWNYAVFKGDKSLKQGVNQARCFACHTPEADKSYVFSLKALQETAKKGK
ncbi:MAG: cytochrome P460 family protein [Proteobacteria bacterium]|nr:cytochrome P460 family protein [Pseudomonadota bacterium]